ncbi:hypothetical protein K6119_03735 [Paracrocinitomix mangrovi]|uniref:hypothetical protein n=1 Tax=Paracrocinitomix mangrovi TaxID=2862509 RepID=UPI001C8E5CA8|nr:hypothetical protein [Paracrocinitomix mangrovi]UKN02622.1 hypothetical protein K6119_03735 [Paracrocinitomix mangrovi]
MESILDHNQKRNTFYYQPSGKSDITSVFFFVGLCLLIIPFAFIYSLAIWYIPFPYINYFITAGFGLLVGLGVNYLVLKFGKVRNVKTSILYASLAGIFAWYAQWAFYADFLLHTTNYVGNSTFGMAVTSPNLLRGIGQIFRPGEIFTIMGVLYTYGSWGIFGITFTGLPLALIWIGELGIIIATSISLVTKTSKKPFCEFTNKWFKEQKIGPFEYIYDKPAFRNKLEQGDTDSFDELVYTKNDGKNHVLFNLFQSPQGENYLAVTNIRVSINNGRMKKSEEQFVPPISINDRMIEMLMNKTDGSAESVAKVRI